MRIKIVFFLFLVFVLPFNSICSKMFQMDGSNRFRVEVREKGQRHWKKLIVYHSINPNLISQDISWSSFAAFKPMELRISSDLQKVDSVRIRPGAYKINHSMKDNFLFVNIDKPMKISVEINGDKNHPLLLFAEPPETKPHVTKGGKVIYFKTGIHSIGERYPLLSNTTYYLEEGAILMGSIIFKRIPSIGL